MWRPRGIAETLELEKLEQPFDRAWMLIDPGMPISHFPEPRGHRSQREVRGVAVVDLLPRERGGNACVRGWAHRICRGDGTILRILVVVDEYSVALLLPPLARR